MTPSLYSSRGPSPAPATFFHSQLWMIGDHETRTTVLYFLSEQNGAGGSQVAFRAGRVGKVGGSRHQLWLWLHLCLPSQAGLYSLCCRLCKGREEAGMSQWRLSLRCHQVIGPTSKGLTCYNSGIIGATVYTCHLWVKEMIQSWVKRMLISTCALDPGRKSPSTVPLGKHQGNSEQVMRSRQQKSWCRAQGRSPPLHTEEPFENLPTLCVIRLFSKCLMCTY